MTNEILSNPKHKKIWLLGLIVLVLFMISVGGRTRLTRSGLSITEWKPITGVIPPITDAQWEEEFTRYKNTPEYKGPNAHFELADYKNIYFWEFVHRLLGRLIFLYAFLPGLYFLRRREITGRFFLSLTGLILFQGLMGWVMVRSGLQNEPRVSPFLLATHFFLAQALLVLSFYHIAQMREKILVTENWKNKVFLVVLGGFLTIQLFYGSLTSGMRAGLVSNTFPLMNGELMPDLLLQMSPWFNNVFQNPFTVQWIHRWLGVLTLVSIFATGFHFMKNMKQKQWGPFIHLMGIASVQVAVGILVILLRVPISLAGFHQFLGSLIFLGYFNIVFRT